MLSFQTPVLHPTTAPCHPVTTEDIQLYISSNGHCIANATNKKERQIVNLYVVRVVLYKLYLTIKRNLCSIMWVHVFYLCKSLYVCNLCSMMRGRMCATCVFKNEGICNLCYGCQPWPIQESNYQFKFSHCIADATVIFTRIINLHY